MDRVTLTNKFGENVTIKVGDVVYFKSDYEQNGRVTEILADGRRLRVRNDNCFIGEYIGGKREAVIFADDCSVN